MKISHVNHSSLICETDSDLLVTDPWIFSNAFQGWYQCPGPNIESIKKIFGVDNKLSIVVLSHAHDDHVDDIFISHCPEKVKFVIPKTKNSAFKNRILKNGINLKNIIEINENGKEIGSFFISCFSSGDLTEEDFIILISNKKYLLIHANDNWHQFSQELIDYIQSIKTIQKSSEIFLMSQVGIADSYPIFYEGISSKEKVEIIRKKVKLMCGSLIINSQKLGLNIGYAYANQSKFANLNKLKDLGFDPYLIKEEVIRTFDNRIKQLMPCDKIIEGNFIRNEISHQTILEYRLNYLEKLFNKYSLHKNPNALTVNFKTLVNRKTNNNQITLYASETIWNDILNGSINLESIITGGAGLIDKPDGYNMKREYLLLSKWAYINQNRAKSDLTMNL